MDEAIKEAVDLLDELKEYIDSASFFPVTKKVLVEPDIIREYIDEIKDKLPDDLEQARWIRGEKDRIIADAKTEYNKIIAGANEQARYLIQSNEITKAAMKQASDIIADANFKSKDMKMRTYDYVDKMLYQVQNRIDELNVSYLGKMYTQMTATFDSMNQIIENNRNEIRDMAYKTQMSEDGRRKLTAEGGLGNPK